MSSSFLSARALSAQDAQACVSFGAVGFSAGAKKVQAGSLSGDNGNVEAHELDATDVDVLGVHVAHVHADEASLKNGQMQVSGVHSDGFSWNPEETVHDLTQIHWGNALRDLSRGKWPHLGIENVFASAAQAEKMDYGPVHMQGVQADHLAAQVQGGLKVAATGVQVDQLSHGRLRLQGVSLDKTNVDNRGKFSATGLHADSGSLGFLKLRNANIAHAESQGTRIEAHDVHVGRAGIGEHIPIIGTLGVPVHLHDLLL